MITHEYLQFESRFARPMGTCDTLRDCTQLRASVVLKGRRGRSKFRHYVGVLVVDGWHPRQGRVRVVRRIKLTGDQLVRLKANRSGPVLVAGRYDTALCRETGERKQLVPIGYLAGFTPVRQCSEHYGPAFAPGQRVRVTVGAFAGTVGTVDDYSPTLGWAVVVDTLVASRALTEAERADYQAQTFWYDTHELEAAPVPATV